MHYREDAWTQRGNVAFGGLVALLATGVKIRKPSSLTWLDNPAVSRVTPTLGTASPGFRHRYLSE